MATNWLYPTITICTYGFFKDMKPSEPFLTPYLNSSYKNIDEKAISDQIYPISTYSYLAFLFLVFVLTDFLRYKPLIILESLAYLSTRFILVWGNGIPIMQVMQLTYGLASACEIAYYSYIYAMVDESHYRQVTSYTRAVTLLGRGLSDVLGQILISTQATNYLVLNYISLGSVSIAFIVALFLPRVNVNVFASVKDSYEIFDNEPETSQSETIPEDGAPSVAAAIEPSKAPSCCIQWKAAILRMFVAFKLSYSNKLLLMWSIWWAFAMCGGLQVEDYVMNLWSHITGPNSKKVYNGGVFACGTLLSALVVFLFSLAKVQWKGIPSEVLIGVISLVDTVLLFVMAHADNVWIAYATYVIFRASYAFVLTVASYQIALHVEMKGFALIFGWNTFIALSLQSLLTLIVTDKRGLDLGIRDQFIVYGCYFGVIGVVFISRPLFMSLKMLNTWLHHRFKRNNPTRSNNDTNTTSVI